MKHPTARSINAGGKLIDFSVPKVMGIVNITPDSFYAASRKQSPDQILELCGSMLEEGADLLDIGGCSTRPGSIPPSPQEETDRILPALEQITKTFPDAIISVDTYRSKVAEEAVKAGANIINDISGWQYDPDLLDTVARLNVPYILSHVEGTPEKMQIAPTYKNVVEQIAAYFSEKIGILRSKNVNDIIIDPGIGFGKTQLHNFEILKNISVFKTLTDCPLLIGLSRKGLIWKTLGISPEQALTGTVVLNTVALLSGADIIRVHDVKEAAQTVRLLSYFG